MHVTDARIDLCRNVELKRATSPALFSFLSFLFPPRKVDAALFSRTESAKKACSPIYHYRSIAVFSNTFSCHSSIGFIASKQKGEKEEVESLSNLRLEGQPQFPEGQCIF